MAELTLAEIAAKADAYYATRRKRLDLSQEVDSLKSQESSLQQELINVLVEQDVDGVQGKNCRVSLKVNTTPLVVDWDKYDNYILEQQDLSLLERRISVAAIRDRWDEGINVPGIKEEQVNKLSVNKV